MSTPPQPPSRRGSLITSGMLVVAFVLVLVVSVPKMATSTTDMALVIGSLVGIAGVVWGQVRQNRRH